MGERGGRVSYMLYFFVCFLNMGCIFLGLCVFEFECYFSRIFLRFLFECNFPVFFWDFYVFSHLGVFCLGFCVLQFERFWFF